MRLVTLVCAGVLFCCGLTATATEFETDVDTAQKPWTHLGFKNNPREFQFAVVADNSGGARPGVFHDALAKVNLLRPEFVMCVGDLIEGYTADRQQLSREWTEIQAAVAQLSMPFFFVPGNHDYASPIMAEQWHKRFGPAYYHFIYKDVLFLVLCTDEPPHGNISETQVKSVAKALAEYRDVRWTMVFMHRPMYDMSDNEGWEPIETLLQDRPYTVICGHAHEYEKQVRHGRTYLRLATTGAGSGGGGVDHGQFDHTLWITMTDEGPVFANIMTDGIYDENIPRKERKAALTPIAKGQVVVPDPWVVDGKTFNGGATRIRLANPANAPMTLKATFQEHPRVTPDPPDFECVIQPASEQWIDVALDGHVDVASMKPLRLNWNVSYANVGGEPLSQDGSSVLRPADIHACVRRDEPVILDGRLDEWPELPVYCEVPIPSVGTNRQWRGPADSSFRFGWAYDDEYLYLALQTIDDKVVVLPEKTLSEQDNFVIWLDARPDPLRSNPRRDLELALKEYVVIVATPGDSGPDARIQDKQMLQPGMRLVSAVNDAGIGVELAVPLSYVTERQGNDWDAVRVNIAIQDYDEPLGKRTNGYWRPLWIISESYAGSGTFKKQ